MGLRGKRILTGCSTSMKIYSPQDFNDNRKYSPQDFNDSRRIIQFPDLPVGH